MNASSDPIVAFLHALTDRMQQHGAIGHEIIQFHVAAPAGTRSWYIGTDPRAPLCEGRHPSPTWSITCSTETLVAIAEQRFDARDPKAASALQITGDALALYDRLGPFLAARPDRFGRREAAARRTGSAQLTEIRRLDELSTDAIEWAAEHLVPVVFSRGLRELALWRWTIPDLLARCTDVPHVDFTTYRETTLTAYLQQLLDDPAQRNGGGGLHVHDELARDVRVPDLYPISLSRPMMWCSGRGAVTLLHRDLTDVLNLQVIGSKRWTLYSPDQARLLYVLPPDDGYQQARVSPARRDDTRFPAFCDARACEIVVNAGDIVFNPGGWFHEVEALSLSLSLSFGVTYTTRLPAPAP